MDFLMRMRMVAFSRWVWGQTTRVRNQWPEFGFLFYCWPLTALVSSVNRDDASFPEYCRWLKNHYQLLDGPPWCLAYSRHSVCATRSRTTPGEKGQVLSNKSAQLTQILVWTRQKTSTLLNFCYRALEQACPEFIFLLNFMHHLWSSL